MSEEDQTIGSNESQIEFSKSDEKTPQSQLETNHQQKVVTEEGASRETNIVYEEDHEQAEHARQVVYDILDNLDGDEEDQSTAIASLLHEEVSS